MKGLACKNQPKQPTFIVIDDSNKAWIKLDGNFLVFSEDWDIAKPLVNDMQFKCLQRMTHKKLEKLYL